MFNVVDFATGWKVDLIVRKPTVFAKAEFARRIETELLGVRSFVATAEDTLLAKLVWAKASGGSERQLRDVSGIVDANAGSLDVSYIERWIDELDVRLLVRPDKEVPFAIAVYEGTELRHYVRYREYAVGLEPDESVLKLDWLNRFHGGNCT